MVATKLPFEELEHDAFVLFKDTVGTGYLNCMLGLLEFDPKELKLQPFVLSV